MHRSKNRQPDTEPWLHKYFVQIIVAVVVAVIGIIAKVFG
jgi:hypothetical protein